MAKVESCFRYALLLSFIGAVASTTLAGAASSVALVCALVLMSQRHWRQEITSHPLFIPLFLFSASVVLSILFGKPFAYEKPVGKLRYYFFLLLAAAWYRRHSGDREVLLRVASWVAPVILGIAFVQFAGWVTEIPFFRLRTHAISDYTVLRRPIGLHFNPNPFAASAATLFFLFLPQAWLANTGEKRYRFYALSALSAFGVVVSLTRGAWAGLVAGLALVLAAMGSRRAWKWTLLSLVTITLVASAHPFFRARVGVLRESIHFRWKLWEIGWRMFRDSPWFGQGFHSFGAHMHQYLDESNAFVARQASEVHNMYVDVLAGTGLVGIFAFLLWIGVTARTLWRARFPSIPPADRAWSLTGLGLLGFFLVGGIADKLHTMTTFIVGYVIVMGASTSVRPLQQKS